MIAANLIGISFILLGWLLFLYFLTHSLQRPSGWIPIEVSGWTFVATGLASIRGALTLKLRETLGGILITGLTLFLALPMILAPLLIVCFFVGTFAGVFLIARYWLVAASIIVVLICVGFIVSTDCGERSDANWAFYCWPISNLLVTIGIFLL